MPSMEGVVLKNIIIITNYLSKFINDIELITFDNKFNRFFNKKIKIINFGNHSKLKQINTISILFALSLNKKNTLIEIYFFISSKCILYFHSFIIQ